MWTAPSSLLDAAARMRNSGNAQLHNGKWYPSTPHVVLTSCSVTAVCPSRAAYCFESLPIDCSSSLCDFSSSARCALDASMLLRRLASFSFSCGGGMRPGGSRGGEATDQRFWKRASDRCWRRERSGRSAVVQRVELIEECSDEEADQERGPLSEESAETEEPVGTRVSVPDAQKAVWRTVERVTVMN